MDELEVARFASLPEAEAVAALLRTHGIAARLADAHTGNVVSHMQIALGGSRIVVPDYQIVAARDLVARARQGEFAQADFDDGGDEEDADHSDQPRGALGGMRAAAPIIVSLIFLAPLAGCLLIALG